MYAIRSYYGRDAVLRLIQGQLVEPGYQQIRMPGVLVIRIDWVAVRHEIDDIEIIYIASKLHN